MWQDEGVIAVATACNNLDTLIANECQLTNQSLEAIAQHCHNLHELDVSQSLGITDAGLRALAYGCPELRAVKMIFCGAITDAGVKALMDGCLSLFTVALDGCDNVASGFAEKLMGRSLATKQKGTALERRLINWIDLGDEVTVHHSQRLKTVSEMNRRKQR